MAAEERRPGKGWRTRSWGHQNLLASVQHQPRPKASRLAEEKLWSRSLSRNSECWPFSLDTIKYQPLLPSAHHLTLSQGLLGSLHSAWSWREPSRDTKTLQLDVVSAIYEREAVGARRRKMVTKPTGHSQGPGRLTGGHDAPARHQGKRYPSFLVP